MLPLHPLFQTAKRRCRTLLHTHHANRNSIALLTLLAFIIRLYKIGNDNRVVWDETHFGRFATNYLTHTFHLDVHPPLGKLLLALMLWLLGYSGSFDFASGQAYPETVPYTQMRCIQAAIGSLLVPSTFLLCRSLTLPLDAAWMAAFFVAIDNALIGISRIVVLDPMLLLANSLAVVALSRVMLANFARPVANLTCFVYLGISIAVVSSIKLVGLLTAAVIGVYVSIQIIHAFVATKPLEKTQIVEALLVYAGTLVLLPILLYFTFFWIHFSLLRNYAPHADNMGSEYSISLNGSALRVQPSHIYNSSFVTVRAAVYPYEYLYSKKYVDRSNAVRLATSRTFAVENYFQLHLSNKTDGNIITDGSVVSLQAPKTTHYISVFPLSRLASSRGLFVDFEEQTTGKPGATRFGTMATMASARWQLKVTANSGHARGIMPIVSKFKLVSPENKNCELAISRNRASQPTTVYGPLHAAYHLECVFGQGTVWTIEHQLPTDDRPAVDISPHAAKPGLLTSTVSYNRLMYEINSMLVGDPDQYVHVESAPRSWPFLKRPMRLVGWSDGDGPKYMLVGNFLLWWISGFVCIFVHPTLVGLHWIIRKRSGGRMLLLPNDSWKESVVWGLWAAHYLVFFGMSRTTYLHHYLPALYFALILTALYVQRLSVLVSGIAVESTGPSANKNGLYYARNAQIVFALVLAAITYMLAPITFGMHDPCSLSRFRFVPAIRSQLCPRE